MELFFLFFNLTLFPLINNNLGVICSTEENSTCVTPRHFELLLYVNMFGAGQGVQVLPVQGGHSHDLDHERTTKICA